MNFLLGSPSLSAPLISSQSLTWGEVVAGILSGTAVLLLAWITRSTVGLRKDFRRFMTEHSWLLATSLWNREKTLRIMEHLQMPIDGEPPTDLPWKERNGT